MPSFASLADEFPGIATEADGWDPTQVAAFSSRKLGWKCAVGHTYAAIVNNRTSKKSGCPYCSGTKALIGFNDLLTEFPIIAAEAEGWDPTEFTSGSSQKKPWKCRDGHTWITSINHRTTNGTNCPYCAGQRAIIGQNDLKTTNPEIAREAEGWDPTTVKGGSHKILKWMCPAGHHYSLSPLSRTLGAGCPYCGNRKILQGFNDLQTAFPQIASQADGWNPAEFMPGSSIKKKWRCAKNHYWDASIQNRTVNGSGCPFCAGQIAIFGETDLASRNPRIAAEAHKWDPSTCTEHSNQQKEWKCIQGHIWIAVVSSRVRGNGCPYCSGKRAIIGETDLLTTHPELAGQLNDLDPATVTAGSSKLGRWSCANEHVWTTRINHRVNGSGCPYCSGKRAIRGINDLQTTQPRIASEAFGWDPGDWTEHAGEKKKWRCSLGHVYTAVIGDRTRPNGTNCPYCSNKKVLAGFNDLASVTPSLAAQAHKWDPSQVTIGSSLNKEWICEKGHIWKAVISSRSRGNGCPSCAKFGFDPNRSGWIYLLQHESWELLQIGITNVPDQRLAAHQKLGWEVVEVQGPMKGELARTWETDILKFIRSKNVGLANTSVAGKFDGFSESWSRDLLPIRSIRQLQVTINDNDKLST